MEQRVCAGGGNDVQIGGQGVVEDRPPPLAVKIADRVGMDDLPVGMDAVSVRDAPIRSSCVVDRRDADSSSAGRNGDRLPLESEERRAS